MGKLDRLKALLREMFQLERGDLDFGLYRIMGMKSAEVAAFLDKDLLPQVQDRLKLTGDRGRADLEKEIRDAVQGAEKLGVAPEDTPHVKKLRVRLAGMRKDADAEADVYNHLANFFARYCTEGDFMSQRRYSGGGRSSYLIPYDGEEVKLHWANADQYYIKTTENYASYVFTVDAGGGLRRVRFEIAAADNEKDNVKETADKQRRFVLARGKGAVAVLDVATAAIGGVLGDAADGGRIVAPDDARVVGVYVAVAVGVARVAPRRDGVRLARRQQISIGGLHGAARTLVRALQKYAGSHAYRRRRAWFGSGGNRRLPTPVPCFSLGGRI